MSLDPDAVLAIYDGLRSYQAVADELARRGVKNPRTGEPYTRLAIKAALRRSKRFVELKKKVRREEAESLSAQREVARSVKRRRNPKARQEKS